MISESSFEVMSLELESGDYCKGYCCRCISIADLSLTIAWRIKEWVNHESETCSLYSKLDLYTFVLFSRSFSLAACRCMTCSLSCLPYATRCPSCVNRSWGFSGWSTKHPFMPNGFGAPDSLFEVFFFPEVSSQSIQKIRFATWLSNTQFLSSVVLVLQTFPNPLSNSSAPSFGPWRQPGTHTFRSRSVDESLILWYFNILNIVRKVCAMKYSKIEWYSMTFSFSIRFHHFPVFQDLVDLTCNVRTCIPLFWRMWRQVGGNQLWIHEAVAWEV